MPPLTTNRDGSVVNRAYGERGNFRRARKYVYGPGKVITDGHGNVKFRPLTRGLPCFGDVVEYVRGVGDAPYHYHTSRGVEESPWFCGGCRVSAACGKVALERIASAPDVQQSYDAWEKVTMRLPRDDRYKDPTFAKFVEATDAETWADGNDAEIEADNARRAAAARVKRKAARRAKKKLRSVPENIRAAIEVERQLRASILLDLHKMPGAPRHVAKLSIQGCERTAKVWAMNELLIRQGVKKGFNRKIAAMIGVERPATIGTDLRRIDRLQAEPEDSPVWSEFAP